MPRRPKEPAIVCEYFAWRLFRRQGVYYADGRSRADDLGKHSLSTRDRNEALENLRALDREMAVRRGRLAPEKTTPAAELAITEGWKLYLAYCDRSELTGGVSRGTKRRYESIRKNHEPYCGKQGIRSWQQFDNEAAVRYASHLEKQDYAVRTVYIEVTTIKSVVLWLIKNGKLPDNCRLSLHLHKPVGSDTFCYTKEQVAAMVEHCRSHADLNWLMEVIVGLACTGLRIGELAALRWSDLHLDEGAPLLRLTDDRASQRRRQRGSDRRLKGRRGRSLPIHPSFLQVLRSMTRHSDGRVFHGPRGGRLKGDTVRLTLVNQVIESLNEKFPTAKGDIGFADGRVHSFRHYFCSQAFRDGVPETDIREWLGHRDSEMVGLYRHVADEDRQRRMGQIDFLGNPEAHGA
jgi:integrase